MPDSLTQHYSIQVKITGHRTILHADLDAFYASVEQRDDPSLMGKPVLVGGSPEGRGVVAACSYEARRFGIHSAMPMRTALARCPRAVVVQPRFDLYRQVSDRVMEIFRSITPLVQPLSLDEAYLDVTAQSVHDHPEDIARRIKQEVRTQVGLSISVGVATSKVVAKIASDINKPDGLVMVAPGTERGFLSPLPVRRLPGIGPSAEKRLEEQGVATIGDLANQDEEWLRQQFGKRGPELRSLAIGDDHSPVVTERITKSISAENTFAHDLADPEAVFQEVRRLSQRVAERLQLEGLHGRTVTLKLRLPDFTTLTRSLTGTPSVGEYEQLAKVAIELARRELAPGRRFRLLGVGVSNFNKTEQLILF